MKRILFLTVLSMMCLFVLTECFNKTQPVVEKKPEAKLITHKEAVDTMRADSNAPVMPLIFKKMTSNESYVFLKDNDISSLLAAQYPRNGFFGADNYRIEFVVKEAKRDSFNVNIYHLKGMNRHKGIITPFEGEIRILDVSTFIDPNLSPSVLLKEEKLYAANGVFELREDKNAQFSGSFTGDFKTEFHFPDYGNDEKTPSFWYYSDGLPSQGGGYRFDGMWTNYTDPNDTKKFLFADDLFRFANTILKDFSYGEREIEINPQYRNLGWQNLWEAEEWWTTPEEKLKM